MCVSHDISITIVGFGDQTRACRKKYPCEPSETNPPLFNKSFFAIYDELSDNNV